MEEKFLKKIKKQMRIDQVQMRIDQVLFSTHMYICVYSLHVNSTNIVHLD